MQQNTTVITITFVVYTVLLLLIGLIAYQRTRNLSDYILGGRRLGIWVTALSAGASDMSGWLLLGLPGYAYIAGFEAGWIALGLFIGTYFNWRIVAPRLRCYSVIASDSLTIPDFLQHRFDDKSHLLRLVAAFFIVLFFLFYTSSGLVAGAKLFNTVFGMSYHWALSIGASVILIYTFIGGFLAVSWTDLFQGLLMALVLIVVPLVVIAQMGGWELTSNAMARTNPALLNMFTDNTNKPLTLIAIISLLGWGLGYFGQPHILARFKAIESISNIAAARRIATTWVFITLSGALLVGFTGVAYVPETLQGADTEKVFMLMVNMLFHPVIAGICLAAILAAIMSTADSQLLVSASVLTRDFYKSQFRRQASEQELVWTGRVAVLIVTLIALGLAWEPGRKVLDLVAYAWAGFGAAFGPVLVLSLFWVRMTRNGALAGMLAGGATVVIWKSVSGGIFDLYEIVPGVIIAILAIVFFSLMDKTPAATIKKTFTSVQEQVNSTA